MKMKESKNFLKRQILGFGQRFKKLVEYVGDCGSTLAAVHSGLKKIGGIWYSKKNSDHTDHKIVVIGENIQTIPEDIKSLRP